MRISKNDIPFRKRYKPQLTEDWILETSALPTKNLSHSSSKVSTKKKFLEIFIKKRAEKLFQIEGKSISKLNSYKSAVIVLLQNFYPSKYTEKRMGGCFFRNIIPFSLPKGYWEKICFHRWQRKFWVKKVWPEAYWTRIGSMYCCYSFSQDWQSSTTSRFTKIQI